MANSMRLSNGPGAAAILAAGIGSFVLGLLSLASDAVPAIRNALAIWQPSGALSGESTAAIVVWLVSWFVLSRLWSRRDLSLARVNLTAFGMLLGGLLLTFPPFMDLLQGK